MTEERGTLASHLGLLCLSFLPEDPELVRVKPLEESDIRARAWVSQCDCYGLKQHRQSGNPPSPDISRAPDFMQSPNCSPQHASYLSQSTDDLVLPWLKPEALEPEAARPAQMMQQTMRVANHARSRGFRWASSACVPACSLHRKRTQADKASLYTGSWAAAQRDIGVPLHVPGRGSRGHVCLPQWEA